MQSKTNSPKSKGLTAAEIESEEDDQSSQGKPVPDRSRELGLDQVFEILKNQRRRYVLAYLRDRTEPVSLSELSEQIAAWENDKEVRAITSSERKRVYVGLYQCHLPKMDGMEVVSFNKPRARVEPGENIDLFYPYLDTPTGQGDRKWSRYYLGLSIASVIALAGGVLLQITMSVPATVVVAGLSVAAFATTAVIHRSDRQDTDEE